MMRPILGIDPGLSGAVALLTPDGELFVHDIPTLDVGGRKRPDAVGLAHMFDAYAAQAPSVWIEDVGVRPGEGAVGAFSFGKGVGMLLGVAAAHFMPVEVVRPATWKKAMGLPTGATKDESRARASALLPQHAGLWPLKKHDGRAESALIALYGLRNAQKVCA